MTTTEHGRQAMEHLSHPAQPISYTRAPKRTKLEVWRDLAVASLATLWLILTLIGVTLALAGALAVGNALNDSGITDEPSATESPYIID